MNRTLRGFLRAPIPSLLLLCLLLMRPSEGLLDCLYTVLMATGFSYGFMLLVGLLLHQALQYFGWQSWPHYFWSFQLGLVATIGVITFLEGTPAPPLPDDNSPFAALTINSGGAAILFVLFAPFVAIMTTMFWNLVVASPSD